MNLDTAFAWACLAAAALSVLVVIVTYLTTPLRTRAIGYFIALNVSTGIWALAEFAQVTQTPARDPSVLALQSADWWIWPLTLAAICGSVVCYFLFAASQTHHGDLLRGWPALIAWGGVAYTMVAGLTNPLHHLFATQPRAGGQIVLGPFAFGHSLWAMGLVSWATYLIAADLWSRRNSAHRTAALLVTLGLFAELLAWVGWVGLQRIGIHVPGLLAPIVMPVVTLTLWWAVLNGILGHTGPTRAAHSYQHNGQPTIAVDDRLVVVAVNPAAEEFVPKDAIGRRLDDFMPAVAARATDAMHSVEGYRVFEHTQQDRQYWGRATCTRLTDAPLGCVVTFSDISDDPYSRQQLKQHLGHGTLDGRRVISPDVRGLVETPRSDANGAPANE